MFYLWFVKWGRRSGVHKERNAEEEERKETGVGPFIFRVLFCCLCSKSPLNALILTLKLSTFSLQMSVSLGNLRADFQAARSLL